MNIVIFLKIKENRTMVILLYLNINFLILIKKTYGINSSLFLLINGTGTQQILYDNRSSCVYYVNINQVDKIYVNDIMQETNDYFVYNLNKQINNVTISFKNRLQELICMFYNCKSIISVDFTNFDSSEVNSTGSMFYNCTSLLSLNLTNFDTSKVTWMDYMFYNCNSLISLDFARFNTSNVLNIHYMFYNCIIIIRFK